MALKMRRKGRGLGGAVPAAANGLDHVRGGHPARHRVHGSSQLHADHGGQRVLLSLSQSAVVPKVSLHEISKYSCFLDYVNRYRYVFLFLY